MLCVSLLTDIGPGVITGLTDRSFDRVRGVFASPDFNLVCVHVVFAERLVDKSVCRSAGRAHAASFSLTWRLVDGRRLRAIVFVCCPHNTRPRSLVSIGWVVFGDDDDVRFVAGRRLLFPSSRIFCSSRAFQRFLVGNLEERSERIVRGFNPSELVSGRGTQMLGNRVVTLLPRLFDGILLVLDGGLVDEAPSRFLRGRVHVKETKDLSRRVASFEASGLVAFDADSPLLHLFCLMRCWRKTLAPSPRVAFVPFLCVN